MRLSHLRRNLIQGTLLTTFVLGILSLATILDRPKTLELDASALDDRSPSSVDAKDAKGPQSATISLECGDRELELSSISLLRIKGHFCLEKSQTGDKTIKRSEVENTRNGYNAAVFPQKDEFSTDFIQLTEGANPIVIRHITGDGKTIQREFLVNLQKRRENPPR